MEKTLTPADVAAQLKIGVSTLRKYSLLLEENGVTFKRNAQNSRQYGESDVMALQRMITLMKSDGVTVENAAFAVASAGIERSEGTEENGVIRNDVERYGGDMAGVTLNEIRKLQEEVRKQQEIIDGFRIAQEKRDAYFVQVLEELHTELQILKEQKSLPDPALQTEENEDSAEDNPKDSAIDFVPTEKEVTGVKGFLKRILKL